MEELASAATVTTPEFWVASDAEAPFATPAPSASVGATGAVWSTTHRIGFDTALL